MTGLGLSSEERPGLRAKPLVQDNVNVQTLWRINFAFQPQLAGLEKVYATNVQVTMSNGDRLTPGTTVLGQVTSSFVLLEAGSMLTQEVTVGGRAAVTKNPSDRPVKLVVGAVRVKGISYPAITVDLSCQTP